MESLPWLSVILCTYQGERFLPAALESVAGQDASDIEVIAVDDGSTDDTPAILEAYAARLPLHIERIAHTGNWVRNTNTGLHLARGGCLCLLHQDDLWLPDRLRALKALADAYPDVGFFASPARYIDAAGRTVGRWTPPLPGTGRPLPPAVVLERLLVQNCFALPAPMFRRDLARSAGDMDTSLWFLADWKYWGALIAATPVVLHPEPLAAFRLHPHSQTLTRSRDAADLRSQYLDVFASIEARLDPTHPGVRFARQAAQLNMAISIALAGARHAEHGGLGNAAATACRTHPAAWYRFLRDACIRQRVAARLRARLGNRQ